jgi:hypothetical protein
MTTTHDGMSTPAAPPASAATPFATASSGTGPLSPEQLQELAWANARVRTLRRAGRLAAFNGWTLGACAVLCLPFAFFDMSALLIAACLGGVTFAEFYGRHRLLTLDLRGPRILGINQLVLLGLIIAYCAMRIIQATAGPDISEQILAQSPQLSGVLDAGAGSDVEMLIGSVGELYRKVVIAVYVSVIVASTLVQGLCALYYLTREKHLRAYLEQTPAWVIEIQRQG